MKYTVRAGIMMVVFLTAVLSGCAQKGPILVDFKYEKPQGTVEASPKGTMGISSFKDERGKSPSAVGRRFNSLSDQANDLVVQGTVSDKVTTALKDALNMREITVRDNPAWDLTAPGIPLNEADIAIGGEIKTLWVDTASSLANTTVKAKVELRIVAADVGKKKIIRALTVSSAIERQNISFSTALVEDTISEAISTALNQFFGDEEIKKILSNQR
jgi:hypothetical protein